MSPGSGEAWVLSRICMKKIIRSTWVVLILLLSLKVAGVTAEETGQPVASEQDTASDAPSSRRVKSGNETAGEDAEPAFHILQFRVFGNSILPDELIQKALYSFMGYDRTVHTVELARQNLEKLYHNAGYPGVIVYVPEQNVDDDIVRLQVLEGEVDRVKVTGTHYIPPDSVRERFSAEEGRPLNMENLQQDINSFNRQSSDRRVTPVLRPGREQGEVELELKVEDRLPLHVNIGLNNHNTKFTTRPRAVVGLSYDNLWQKLHSVSFNYLTAPEDRDEQQVYALAYSLPVGGHDQRLVLQAVSSETATTSSFVSASGATAGSVSDSENLGNGDTYGLRYYLPLGRHLNFTHTFILGYDYKDYEDITIGGTTLDNTRIDYSLLSFTHNASYYGTSSRSLLNWSFNFSPRFGGKTEDLDDKRFGADENMFYLKFRVEHERLFNDDWGMTARLALQATDQALISNEQISIGGEYSVRGYYEGQASGDIGAYLRLQADYLGLSRLVESRQWAFFRDTKVSLFYDWGKVRFNDALLEQIDEFELAGAGLALETHPYEGFIFSASYAQALRDSSRDFNRVLDSFIEAGDRRLNVSLDYRY